MSAPVVYVTLEDLLAIIDAEFGEPRSIVRDIGLLASAVDRHAAVVFGEDVYPGLAGKAAALLHSLVTSHPLLDGNKRLGALGLLVFYGLNGVRLDATDDELYDLIIAIAEGTQRDVENIAAVLRVWETQA